MTDLNNEFITNEYSDREIIIAKRIKEIQEKRRIERSIRFVHKIKVCFVFCTVIVICYGLYKFAKMPQWYLKEGAFKNLGNNSQIQIEGNVVTSNYKIQEALRQVNIPHLPIYLVNTKEIKENIEMLEPVKKAYIRRFGFPARFVIRIEERVPILTISTNEKVPPIAFFTTCGKLISNSYLPLPKNYKTYLVLTYGIKGDDYYNWDLQQVNTIVFWAKEIERLSGETVEYIDLRNPKDIYVKLTSALIRIGEIDSTLYNRIKNIGSILPSLSTLKNKKIKYIDLRWETNYLKLDNHTTKSIPENSDQTKIR